ncbi:MAG: TIGR00296 family protein [Thermoplasmata archaeon]|nr:TIGR00296 family protein [Thermoplasmata archaeon]
MKTFSDADGEKAVRAARMIVESYVNKRKLTNLDLPEEFSENGGVFVTLKTHPDEELRGCIGYPEPIMPLRDALIDSAISAASRDPRFPPVSSAELPELTVEVSLLTPPEPINVSNPDELLSKVKIGEDGLIAERGWTRGLLLPQVPVEWNWGVEEFLRETCRKAGMSREAWRDPETKFYKFQAEVFSEEKPNGNVKREILSGRDGCNR